MRQGPGGVRRVRIDVADAPGNAAVQRLVVQLHRRVRARCRHAVDCRRLLRPRRQPRKPLRSKCESSELLRAEQV